MHLSQSLGDKEMISALPRCSTSWEQFSCSLLTCSEDLMSAQWQLQEQGTCLTNRFIFFPPGIIAFFFSAPFLCLHGTFKLLLW